MLRCILQCILMVQVSFSLGFVGVVPKGANSILAMFLSSSSSPGNSFPDQEKCLKKKGKSVFAGLIMSSIFWNGLVPSDSLNNANAADVEWNDYNRLAAETWRSVDELFLDRSFNGLDWFKLRQNIVKRSYKTEEEVFTALQETLAKLGIFCSTKIYVCSDSLKDIS